MATYTEHYNLIKPALNDKVNINNLNDNADIIDTALNNKVDTDETRNITTSAVNCMMSDGTTSVEDAVANIGNDTNLGNVQGSGTIALDDSVSNYRFIQIRIGYYDSGYPCFGQALLPVSTLLITADDFTTTVAFSDLNGTISGKADISFLSATSVKVVSTSSTVYTKLVGIA